MAKKDKGVQKEIKQKGFFIQARSRYLNGITNYCSKYKKRTYSDWSDWMMFKKKLIN